MHFNVLQIRRNIHKKLIKSYSRVIAGVLLNLYSISYDLLIRTSDIVPIPAVPNGKLKLLCTQIEFPRVLLRVSIVLNSSMSNC